MQRLCFFLQFGTDLRCSYQTHTRPANLRLPKTLLKTMRMRNKSPDEAANEARKKQKHVSEQKKNVNRMQKKQRRVVGSEEGLTSNWSSAEVGALRKARKEFWESWCLTPTDTKQITQLNKTFRGGLSPGSHRTPPCDPVTTCTSPESQLLRLLLQPVNLSQQLLVLTLHILQLAGEPGQQLQSHLSPLLCSFSAPGGGRRPTIPWRCCPL